jgi:hypothetical protein
MTKMHLMCCGAFPHAGFSLAGPLEEGRHHKQRAVVVMRS